MPRVRRSEVAGNFRPRRSCSGSRTLSGTASPGRSGGGVGCARFSRYSKKPEGAEGGKYRVHEVEGVDGVGRVGTPAQDLGEVQLRGVGEGGGGRQYVAASAPRASLAVSDGVVQRAARSALSRAVSLQLAGYTVVVAEAATSYPDLRRGLDDLDLTGCAERQRWSGHAGYSRRSSGVARRKRAVDDLETSTAGPTPATLGAPSGTRTPNPVDESHGHDGGARCASVLVSGAVR